MAFPRHSIGSSRLPSALVAAGFAAMSLAMAASASGSYVQQATITASNETGEADLGWSVALSADGKTALVGGASGAAWVFKRIGSTWRQEAKLAPHSGEAVLTDSFGESVALSADGNTALVGAPIVTLDEPIGSTGAAWAFTRHGSDWAQQGAKLVGSGQYSPAGVLFGSSLSLSADGNTALIGGSGQSENRGAAWVFTRSRSTWTEQQKLTVSVIRFHEPEFGSGVALSSDGNKALIGGSFGGQDSSGAAWVFTRSGSLWTQQGEEFTGGEKINEPTVSSNFGSSVALAANGDTAVVGGPHDDGGFEEGLGAAWAFSRSGLSMNQQGPKLTGAGEIGGGWFGESVALSSAGETAVIGGPFDNSGIGAVWVFTHAGSTWSQLGEKLTGTGEIGGGHFGRSVAMSADGTTVLIGAPFNDDRKGAALVFASRPPQN